MKHQRFNLPVVLTIILTLFVGCGKVKNKDEITVKIKSTGPSSTEEDIRAAAEAADFFAGDDRKFNSNELGNLALKIKPALEKLIGVDNLPLDAIIDAIVQLFPSVNEGITAGDVVREMHKHLVFLKWFRGVKDLNSEQITQKIKGQYPEASEQSVAELAAAIMRQDKKWAGGDENGSVSKAEMVVPVLLLSGIEKLNFSGALPTQINGLVLTKLVIDQLEIKMDQQVFGRFGESDHKSVGAMNLKLETMSFLMKAAQVKYLVDYLKAGDAIAPGQMQEAVTGITGRSDVDAIQLSKLYDLKVLGGNDDMHMSAVELFQMATDIEFASRVLANPDKVFKSSPTMVSMSKAGKKFDPNADITKITLDTTSAKITDLVFRLYDVDKDIFLTKTEAIPLFKRIGMPGRSNIAAFFSDVGLSDKSVTIITKTKFIFKQVVTLGGPSKLTDVDFNSRMMKVLPRLLENDGTESDEDVTQSPEKNLKKKKD